MIAAAIRRILVALGGLDQDEVSLRSALAVAGRFKAHVGALHAKLVAVAKVGSGRETAHAAFSTKRATSVRLARGDASALDRKTPIIRAKE